MQQTSMDQKLLLNLTLLKLQNVPDGRKRHQIRGKLRNLQFST